MYEEIATLLINSFNVHKEDFHDEVTLEDLGLDSLDLVELSLRLEELGVKVTDDELVAAERFSAVIALVESRVAAQG